MSGAHGPVLESVSVCVRAPARARVCVCVCALWQKRYGVAGPWFHIEDNGFLYVCVLTMLCKHVLMTVPSIA